MSIGDVFAKAWELWRRDVGWLILAGLVVGLILGAVFLVAFVILAAIFAGGAGLSIGSQLSNDSSGGLAAVGAGMLVLAAIVYIVFLLAADVLGMVFYGGLFEMVIGAARENRGVEFGDLFSGFKKFGSFIVYALVLSGISLGLSLLNVLPFIGGIISAVISLWISVIWIYVLPLIADQRLGFGDAAKRSNQMVKDVGWWRTFGMVIVLGLAMLGIVIVIFVIMMVLGKASTVAGLFFGVLLLLAFAVLVPPYAICYISTMYLGSGGAEVLTAPAMPGVPMPGAGMYATPPAPPAYPPVVSGPATPAIAAPPPPPPVDASAWRAAADPLAAQPPSPSVVAPHVHQAPSASDSPGVDGATGQLEKHCSQCGALIGGAEEFCQACALEVSGGEAAAAPAADEAPGTAAPEAPPAAPEAPRPPEAPTT
jgi:hypothetical protein